MAKTDLTAQRLRELLYYDPDTGFFSQLTPRKGPRVGATVGGVHGPSGYTQFMLLRHMYWAHRVAWLYVYGEWPEHNIDHINGERWDNRIANLRLAPGSVNTENRRTHNRNNTVGLLGVRKARQRFQARITHNRSEIHLGTFDTPEEAHEAYLKAKRLMHVGGTI